MLWRFINPYSEDVMLNRICPLFVVGCLFFATHLQAQTPEEQIAAAVKPAPPELQESATVLGYDKSGHLIPLRETDGELVCLADDPSDDRFHVACYHRALEPFMARGRALRAEGMERDEIMATREAEAKDGSLKMPEQPAALYSLTGPPDSFNAETGELTGANPLRVVYIPYATAEETGLPTSAPPGQPWIMDSGKPWAHIMLIPPAPEE